MKMNMYTLPDGTPTHDDNEMYDAWIDLGRWIKDLNGYEGPHSFDPGYVFRFNSRLVTIPADLMIAINEKFDELQVQKQYVKLSKVIPNEK